MALGHHVLRAPVGEGRVSVLKSGARLPISASILMTRGQGGHARKGRGGMRTSGQGEHPSIPPHTVLVSALSMDT